MKDKAKKIIRNILIGAVASLYHTDVSGTENSPKLLLEGLNGEDKKDAISTLKNKIYKNVLKISSNGDTKLIAGHRSHRSHSSHRSSGGGHYSHASHYSSSNGVGSHSSPSSSSSTSASKPVPKTYKTYSLGDRSLKSGMYGNDVSELTSLLVKKKYLISSWITMQNGYPLYNTKVIDAVKRFQKDAGLTQDGVFTSSMTSKLQNWDEGKSTLTLGIRDLSFDAFSTMSGYDVNELIAKLRVAGFPPDPSKLTYNNGKAIFTHDIATAVKLFQAYNGLKPTGTVDNVTLVKLNSITK